MSATKAKPSPGRPSASAPVLALDVAGACEALGVSWDTWKANIEPEVRIVRLGRRKLIAVSELQAWLDRRGETTLGDR
jgi:hypothetical protein